MNKILIKNARILDPSQEMDMQGDILIVDGRIAGTGENLQADAEVIDATGLCAAPGFVDIHVHLRDPGQTYKEDVLTGCLAAAAGGVTSLCCMPNTIPTVDTPEIIRYITEKARGAAARVYPIAAVSSNLKGQSLTDFSALKAAGAIAVSDDGRPVESGGMMLEALKLAYKTGLPLVSHCEDLSIINGGIMNLGKVSHRLGVKGMDRASEDSITAREIVLAESSGTAVHIAHVSTKGSVGLIREAKARGVRVSCETAPHYLFLTDSLLEGQDANFRMNPPLRESADCEAVLAGLLDGTIDAIVTDHAPHSREEKSDFLKAPNGIVGLETSFAASCSRLVHMKTLPPLELVRLMSTAPAKLMNLPGGTLATGAMADTVLFDMDRPWTVNSNKFFSKSHNTPFDGMEFCGQVVRTFLEGKEVFRLG